MLLLRIIERIDHCCHKPQSFISKAAAAVEIWSWWLLESSLTFNKYAGCVFPPKRNLINVSLLSNSPQTWNHSQHLINVELFLNISLMALKCSIFNVIFLYSTDDMCRRFIVVSVRLIFSRLLRQMFNNESFGSQASLRHFIGFSFEHRVSVSLV